MSVVAVRPGQPNEILRAGDLHHKTAQQISSFLGLKKEVLAVRTPNFTEGLEPKDQPITAYPDLVQEKRPEEYPPPDFCLVILPPDTPSTFTFHMAIKTQIPDKFPFMEVPIEKKNIEQQKAGDLLQKCIEVFSASCENCKLLMGENDVASDTPMSECVEFCRKEKMTFVCEIADDLKNQVRKRSLLAAEVVSSEESFVKMLHGLKAFWHPSLAASGIFEELEMKRIFRDISMLLRTHQAFLELVKSMFDGYASVMGPAFLSFAEKFKLSAAFISNYKAVDDLVKKKRQNKTIDQRMQEMEDDNPYNPGYDFLTCYVTPVQRYPRYPLLVRDLEKASAPFHPDRVFLKAAASAIDSLNKNIDNTAHRVKQMVWMTAIQDVMDPFFVQEEGREVLMETNVRLSKSKSGPGVLYLFNDYVLLSTKAKKNQQPIIYVPIGEFRFCNCRPSRDALFVPGDEKGCVIHFNDYEEKLKWMDVFTTLRASELEKISCEKSFAKWTEVEVGEAPAIVNNDGCLIGRHVVFVGGKSQSLSYVSAVTSYGIDDHSWSTKNCKFPPRAFHTFAQVNGIGYLAFGVGKSGCLNDIWKYEDGKVTQIALPSKTVAKRSEHSCVVHGDKLVFFGGKLDDGNMTNGTAIFATSSDEYTVVEGEHSITPRCSHAAVMVGHKMVVIGGKTKKGFVGDVWTFNMKKSKWRKRSVTVAPRAYHRAILSGRYIFVIGGWGNEIPQIQAIDTVNWDLMPIEQFGNIPSNISRFSAVQIDEYRILTYGGIDSTTKSPFPCAWIIDTKDSIIDPPVKRHRTGSTRRHRKDKRSFSTSDSSKLATDDSAHSDDISDSVVSGESTDTVKEVPPAPVTETPPADDSLSMPKPPVASDDNEDAAAQRMERLKRHKSVIPLRPPLVASAVGLSASLEQLYAELKIDVSKLCPMEQQSTKLRAQRLLNLRMKNADDEKNCTKMEMLLSGNIDPPANTIMRMKVFDDSTQTTKISNVNTSSTCEDVEQQIFDLLGRSAELMIVMGNRQEPLTEESLREVEKLVFICERQSVSVVAL